MLEKVLITAFVSVAIWAVFLPDMILGKVREWADKVGMSEFWQKPLFTCPICMSFWYGTALYLILWHASFIEWFITVFGAMGLLALVIYFLSKD